MHTMTSTREFSQTTHEVIPDILSVLPLPSGLPFSLKCLGGVWEGRFLGWEKNCMHLQVTGFPPVDVSQYIQLQYFLKGKEFPSHQFQGLIQDIRVRTGPSVWENITDILLEYRPWHGPTESIRPGSGSFLPVLFGNSLYGQLSNDPLGSSWKTGKADHHMTPCRSFSGGRRGDRETLIDRKGSVQSTALIIEKANGQRISAYHDQPVDRSLNELPIVVIAPGYGETKRDYLTLAYYFASNGFQVIRYDHTNHVGGSDGEHYYITLSSMKDDFQTVTRYASATWPDSPIIGVASSLAARVALKAEAECPSVSLFIMLMGIVNVQRSASTVHQEDIFEAYSSGHSPVSANILGFNVGNQFLSDALTNEFVTLEQTLKDAHSLISPVIVVSAGKDAWVATDDLQAFRSALGERVEKWIVVPEALHRLQENPHIAHATYRQLVAKCHERMTMGSSHGVLKHPHRQDLGRQNRKEKIALQQHTMTEVGPDFWQHYLDNFLSVGKCPDYVKLLDHLFHALGPITPGHKYLDVGCGNGNGGLFFVNRLRAVLPKILPPIDNFIHYVGIDIVLEGLKRANKTMASATSDFHQSRTPDLLMKWSWVQVDVSHPLPFPDNQFDRIISNLVLGYIHDPCAVVKELYRILAPSGRMVISNLKPNGDFSGIYQSLVNSAAFPRQREEARDLLNNYGKIRQAEKEGQFSFFDKTQWKSILATLGCTTADIFPTFAGQAYLIIIEKPAVCAHLQQLNAVPRILKQVA